MRTALALALTLTALASGVHGTAHTQCQNGTASRTHWNIEHCPAGVRGSFIPSMCKGNSSHYKATTADMVDRKFTSELRFLRDNRVYEGHGSPENMLQRGFYHWYGYFHCGAHSREEHALTGKGWHDTGTVKDGVDNAWACEYAYTLVGGVYYCNKDWNCDEADVLECDSFSAMMAAVCTLTADEIKKEVDSARTNNGCANDGEKFSPPPAATTVIVTTPAPSAASGSSPMWVLALAACLFSALPAAYLNA